jgi:hypothetical protein
MRRSLAGLLLLGAGAPAARADSSLQTDIGFVGFSWRAPPPAIGSLALSTSVTPPTPPPVGDELAFGVRTSWALRFDHFRAGLDWDFNPESILAFRAITELAPRLGPLELDIGAATGLGATFAPETSPQALAFVDAVVGLRYRFAGFMTTSAVLERSIISTREMWSGGIMLGADIPLGPRPPAPPPDPPSPKLDAIVWASSVIGRSSEYTSTSWSAAQALGPPDVYPASGDRQGAWASLGADAGPEWISLGFGAAHRVRAIEIYETYNPGAIAHVWLVGDGMEHEVYVGDPAPMSTPTHVLRIELGCTDQLYDGVRIQLDSDAVPGWNEIDAVGIVPCSQ